ARAADGLGRRVEPGPIRRGACRWRADGGVMSKLYRLTVTTTTTGLVWADNESDARDFADDVSEESEPYTITHASAVDVERLAADDLDSMPWGGPGDFTIRQILAGEHEAPPPGPPSSLEPTTIAAWLAL